MPSKKHHAGARFAETLSDEQKSLLRDIREAAERDPAIAAESRQYTKDAASVETEVLRAFEMLKGLRLLKKMSLAEMSERSGISKSDLAALERSETPGVSLIVLARYASALGKDVRISFSDSTTSRPVGKRRKAVAT